MSWSRHVVEKTKYTYIQGAKLLEEVINDLLLACRVVLYMQLSKRKAQRSAIALVIAVAYLPPTGTQ